MRRATLVIPSPCQASWDALTPTGTGRHCAACQKTVVDFSLKTDAEILAALRQAAGPTCGRLRADQLGRALVAPASPPRWCTWLGAVLAAGSVLSAAKVSARASSFSFNDVPVTSPVARRPAGAVAAPAGVLPGGPVVVRGTVVDAATQQGLPGVTVLLRGTATGTATDADGAFELPVPGGPAPVQLVFSAVGFVTQVATIQAGHSQPLAVVLAADTQLMGEVIVTSYKNPWPWCPRLFFNWSKFWLTKPFGG